MIRALTSLFILAIAMVASAGYWVSGWWERSNGSPALIVEMEVKEGSSLNSVSADLYNRGLITHDPKLFQWLWRIKMGKLTVKAGDYKFQGSLSPAKIAQTLAVGQTITVSFTIPEGWNMFQIAERLEAVFNKTGKDKWLELMKAPTFRDKLPGKPETVEGFLYPETYTFSPRTPPSEIISTLIKTFFNNFSEEIVEKGKKLNLTPLEIVTLASIIEKETGKADERPHISSVFHNRLRLKMRLQTDPTVIYGMWDRYDGNIRKQDLRAPTPYNTYTIPGLPPGPIASPGLASLSAAVEPKQTEDLYFVSRGDGSHVFSSNLRDHQNGVIQYQIKPSRTRVIRE